MDGKNAVLNLLAIHQLSKMESWYDEIMQNAIDYAVATIVEKEGLDYDYLVREGR